MAGPDPRFFLTRTPMSAAEACEAAGARLEGDGPDVTHVSAFESADRGAAVFADGANALGGAGRPALVLTSPALAGAAKAACPAAAIGVSDRPKAAFARLAHAMHRSRSELGPPPDGISPEARIAGTAEIAPSAVVGEDALIHADVRIGPYAVIGPGTVIGEGSVIGAHVSISHAVLGAGCTILAGARIGEAGFGYASGVSGAVPVPQLGRVLIGDRVDLGANTAVDRGALSDTVIGEGTKIDNLCQVAHGCRIGAHVLIASQTGISGSCVIGDGVMIGGQAGMADHLTVGDGAVVTAQAGLMKDVPPGERWGGSPAKPARQWMKETAALSRLASGKNR